MQLTKSDLIFLSKLDLEISLTAIAHNDDTGKEYWLLKIKTFNNGVIQESFLYGARGEERKFFQLNALVKACREYAPSVNKVTIEYN